MAQEDGDKVASTTVTENEDGSFESTATTEEGSTGSGSSSDGILSEGTAEEAVSEAVENAKE